MSPSIRVSAPGKLMLLGEHAVVYGHPCIVTAVGQRLTATLTETEAPFLELTAPEVTIEGYRKPLADLGRGEIPKGAGFVELAVRNFRRRHPFSHGVKIETASEFSAQFGFGSSSASTVCVMKGLSELIGLNLPAREIFDLAYETVLDVQKKGSGFDVAAATFGGTLLFEKGGKVIEQLSVQSLPLIIGYTGIKADTVSLIDAVKRKAEKYPAIVEQIYGSIGQLIPDARSALERGDWRSLGELMDVNQGYLEVLGVSSAKLAMMIHAAREAGALGAKLSGAGKGDCMIAIAGTQQANVVKNAIAKAGGEVIDISVQVEGVRLET